MPEETYPVSSVCIANKGLKSRQKIMIVTEQEDTVPQTPSKKAFLAFDSDSGQSDLCCKPSFLISMVLLGSSPFILGICVLLGWDTFSALPRALYPIEHILLAESFAPPLQIPFIEYLFLYIFDQPKPSVIPFPWRSGGMQQLTLKNQGGLRGQRPDGLLHPGIVAKDTG